MKRLVLGSGSWGTALAWVLRSKGIEVVQWCRRGERAVEIEAGEHSLLPGVDLGRGIRCVVGTDLEILGEEFEFAVSAVPTQHLRPTLQLLQGRLPLDIPWLSASKGLERGSSSLPSQVLREEGVDNVGILSGPSHAEEVVRGAPTAVVLGHEDVAVGAKLREALSCKSFRVYSNPDSTGVEWGGVLKNVIALASGIAIGQGFGDNTLAALVTRGAVEMARLGVALGGSRETFNGLSGIGDLMVTCFSDHSRNRRFGIRIGQGDSPEQAMAAMVQVVEGVPTAEAVVHRCKSLSVEMPIAEEVHEILNAGKPVAAGIQSLLSRSLKEE